MSSFKFTNDCDLDKEKKWLTDFCHFSIVAGSLESANSSILASCDHFKEVVGKKIRVL